MIYSPLYFHYRTITLSLDPDNTTPMRSDSPVTFAELSTLAYQTRILHALDHPKRYQDTLTQTFGRSDQLGLYHLETKDGLVAFEILQHNPNADIKGIRIRQITSKSKENDGSDLEEESFFQCEFTVAGSQNTLIGAQFRSNLFLPGEEVSSKSTILSIWSTLDRPNMTSLVLWRDLDYIAPETLPCGQENAELFLIDHESRELYHTDAAADLTTEEYDFLRWASDDDFIKGAVLLKKVLKGLKSGKAVLQ
jgi:hypothetical protein